jgi:hypothetical protein
MNGALPFGNLLDALRDAGLAIGPREHLVFARFLRRYDGASPEELRDAVASLFARSQAEAALVRDVFDALYLRAPASPEAAPPRPDASPPPLPAPPLPVNRRPWWWAYAQWLAPLGLLALCLSVLVARQCDQPTDASPVTAPAPTTPPGVASPPSSDRVSVTDISSPRFVRPSHWPPASEARLRRWPLPSVLLAAAAIAAAAVAGLLQGRRRTVERARNVQQRRFAALPGPRRYELARDDDRQARATVDNLIALLDAGLREAEGRTEIDVNRTVEMTARAGLIPTLVFRPVSGHCRAVVLQDVGTPGRAFRAKTDLFVERLLRRGVELERFWFDRDPTRVSTRRNGSTVALASIAPRLRGRPLVILGTGERLASAAREPPGELREALRAFPARVLLTPLEDPDLWPPGLAGPDSLVGAWPLNARGLRGAAQQMGELRRWKGANNAPPTPRLPVTANDVRRLRAMLALAPAPSFELAEALRQRFLPHAPAEIVLAAEPLVDGTVGAAEKEAIEAAVRWFHRGDRQGREEAEVRRFLLQLLERSRPADPATAAALRHQRDVALQQLYLAETEAERAQVGVELRELGREPLGPELVNQLHDLAATEQRLGRRDAERRAAPLQALASELGSPASARATLGQGRARPTLPGRAAALTIGALSAAAFAALAALGALAPRPLAFDQTRHILWGERDLQSALHAADALLDVYADDGKVYVLAARPSGGNDAGGHTLTAYVIETNHLRPTLKAADLPATLTAAARERDVAWWPLDRGAVGVVVFPEETGVSVAASTPDALELRGDGSWVRRDDLGPQSPLAWATNAERLAIIHAHSKGILPGTADEIVQRLVDLVFEHRAPAPCAAPEIRCGNACVNPFDSPSHCGACGSSCAGEQLCLDGACACPAGRFECAGGCVDLQTDAANCGDCNHRCQAGPCAEGRCLLEPSSPAVAPDDVVIAPPRPQGPGARAPGAQVTELTSEQIQQIVNNGRVAIRRACWEPAVAAKGDAATSTRVTVNTTIGPDGKIQQVTASGGDDYPSLGDCVTRRVRVWVFPSSSGVTQTTMTFRFVVQGSPEPPAPGVDAATDDAKKRFQEGIKFFDERQYERARVAFLQAYALKRHPDILLNVAQCEVAGGRPLEASWHLRDFLRDPATSTHPKRVDAERSLAEVRSKLGRIQVRVDVNGANIFVDDTPFGVSPLPEAIDVAPGGHLVEARINKGEVVSRTVNAPAGQTVVVELPLGVSPAASGITRPAAGVEPPVPP